MGFLLPLPHPSLVAAEQPKAFCVQVVRPHPSSARSSAWLPAEFKVKVKAPTRSPSVVLPWRPHLPDSPSELHFSFPKVTPPQPPWSPLAVAPKRSGPAPASRPSHWLSLLPGTPLRRTLLSSSLVAIASLHKCPHHPAPSQLPTPSVRSRFFL